MKRTYDSEEKKQSYCLTLYERFTPEGSPEANEEFLSKCRPLVMNLWKGCQAEASKTTNDFFDKRYSEAFNACAIKRIERILPEN